MKLNFKIKHSHDNKFMVVYSVPRVGGTYMDFVSNYTFKGFSLAECLSQARNVITSRLYALRQHGVPVPPAHNIEFVWDADTACLPCTMQKQSRFQSSLYSAPSSLRAEEPAVVEVQADSALYEIIQVKGVWTLNKHEFPLMTWEQACELLKQKVESNE